MSRFLTPRDICLLTLVSIYCDGAVPSDGLLPILQFLAAHTGTEQAKETPTAEGRFQKAHDDIDLIKSVKAFDNLLHPFYAAVGLPGRRLWDLFLGKLWDIDSLDALHQFFDDLPSLLATKDDVRQMVEGDAASCSNKTPLMLNSPFALFVRRAHLEFSRLPFADAVGLWKDFVVYRQPTATSWMRRNPSSTTLSFDNVLEVSAPDWAEGAAAINAIAYGDLDASQIAVSANSLDNLIEFQVAQMQSTDKFVCLSQCSSR